MQIKLMIFILLTPYLAYGGDNSDVSLLLTHAITKGDFPLVQALLSNHSKKHTPVENSHLSLALELVRIGLQRTQTLKNRHAFTDLMASAAFAGTGLCAFLNTESYRRNIVLDLTLIAASLWLLRASSNASAQDAYQTKCAILGLLHQKLKSKSENEQ